MAYNPFNIFRRNQKAIFAVLTVFIMIMFTLSSGVVGGDFFETFTQWLGSKGKRGDALCTIDGDKIYQRDLEELHRNRRMANQYMAMLAMTTARQLHGSVNEQLGRLSPTAHSIISRIINTERNLDQLTRDPFTAAQLPFILQNMRADLQRIIESPTTTAEDKDVARTKLAAYILTDPITQGENYFRFAPNRTQRDRIHFLLWQRKADQLGIKFTEEDVKRLVRREVFGRLSDEVQTAVQKQMSADVQNFSMSNCLKALGEEFRVRTAQVAILGPDVHGARGDKTEGGFPMFNPPYEAFEFYRDACSPTSYAVIPVPAANLLAEVDRRLALPPGDPNKINEPTDNELRKLFDQHKDAMYSPEKDTPGFKIPPRIRLEWFQITGEEPYYKAEAEKAIKNELLQANLSAVLGVGTFAAPPGAVAYTAKAFVEDPLLARRYAETVRKHNDDLVVRYSSSHVNLLTPLQHPLQSSVVRPGVPVVAAGGMGGQIGALGNPLAGLAVVVGGPIAYEIRDRVRVGMPAVLGMVPGPGLFNTAMGGAAASQAMLPKPLPIETYRGEFLQTLKEEKAKEIAFGNNKFGEARVMGDVAKFIEEVEKLSEKGRARDMTAARKYIEEFLAKRALPHSEAFAAAIGQAGVSQYVATRGLPRGGNTTPRTEYDLEEDPGLAPLIVAQKDALVRPFSSQASDYTPFGRSFFWDDEMFTRTSRSVSGVYMPKQYPPDVEFGPNKSRFVVWRTEEVSATPRDWDDATKVVVKGAWKRMKARELAKEKADAVANGIRAHVKSIEGGGPGAVSEINLIPYLRDEAEKLRAAAPADPKSQRRALAFPIRGVCPLTSQTGNPAGEIGLPSFGVFDAPVQPAPVRGFQLAPSENIKYPTPEFANSIMDERKKPPGTALVLTDAPKDTYYVVTLVKRDERTETDYLIQVAGGDLSDRMGGPTILAAFRRDAERKTFLSVNALLKLEFKYDETEDQKKKLDEDEKRGGES
jgi:hypothetical protein